jgi:hypothetical protein
VPATASAKLELVVPTHSGTLLSRIGRHKAVAHEFGLLTSKGQRCTSSDSSRDVLIVETYSVLACWLDGNELRVQPCQLAELVMDECEHPRFCAILEAKATRWGSCAKGRSPVITDRFECH